MALRRTIKNAKNNFAPCEVDVRNATSNDKSMASVAVMVRISNYTYGALTSPMVMAMLWKRLNDLGKNWRHVYKGLLLLDYLLKTGAPHIVEEVKENKFALEALLGFQYVDSRGVDKGINVREQAKVTLALLDDENGLREVRGKSMSTQQQLTDSLGKKAQVKGVPAARAEKFQAKANIMPNGEVMPDLAAQERQAIRQAQVESYHQFANSPGGQQAIIEAQMYSENAVAGSNTDEGGIGNANMSEEEALAYALRLSAIESGGGESAANTSNYEEHLTPAPAAQSGPSQEALSAREEEELAIALSLSLLDVQGVNNVLNSDNESDTEPTPPSSPYLGDNFQADGHGYLSVSPPSENLPTYDESLLDHSIAAQSEADVMEQYLGQLSPKGVENNDESDEEL